jgi:hypothetical protein
MEEDLSDDVVDSVLEFEEFQMREGLCNEQLILYRNRLPWLLAHADSFISMSRGNDIAEEVVLYLDVFDDNKDAASYEIWAKVGHASEISKRLKHTLFLFPATLVPSRMLDNAPLTGRDWFIY